MPTHKLTINLSDALLEEIERYKKVAHKQNIEQAITELINYALSLPLYFKMFDWEKAENEADKDIATGNTKSFNRVEDLMKVMI